MKRFSEAAAKKIVDAILVFLLWLLITWSLQWQDVLVGVVFTVLVSFLAGNILPMRPSRLIDPRRLFWLLVYIPYFLYYCVKANLDVAYRVLHPEMPIRPGIVKVRTGLKTDLAKTFLANSITLTPGTLTVDIVDQDFYVHWIYIKGEDVEEHTRIIIDKFEPLLRKIFE
ncbi:MAG TPA: Na+/H+ antiporter subunit E [Planctomycetota bacterium]|nr:Na+/H+ antiporter subunit E [Planctomycetota bacterium]